MSPLSVAGSDPGSATDRNPLRASHFAAAAAARQGSNALDDDTNNSYQSEQQQQQQQQQRARYTAGSIGSMSVLSDDGNSDLMLGGITYPAGEDASTSPHNKLAASPNTFELTATTQHQQQRQRPPSSLPVTLPSCPDSLASFDAFIQGASAPASPLRSGHSFAFSAGTSFHAVAAAAAAATTTTTATAPARLPQKLDRAIGVLDTPLLPLFGLPGSLGESLPVSEAAAIAAAAGSPSQEAPPQQRIQRDGAWEQLERFLHHRARSVESSTASGNSRNNQSGTLKAGGGGGGSGKANGAVADAADVDCVEALLHLLYACVLSTLRHAGQRIRVMEARTESSSSSNTKKTKSNAADEDCARYAAVNHPFLRGVAERGLLSTYMTVCGCSRATVSEDESTPPQQLRRRELPSLNLYVPTRVLRATIADFEEHDAAAIVPAGEGDLRDVKDTLTAASSIVAALERQRKQTGALRTLIGDDVRAWEAARDATRRSRENYFSYWSDYAQRPVQPPAPVHRARPAVDAVLRSMELSVSVQLHHVGQLRRLLSHGLIRDAAGGAFVGSGRGETEKEVRRYLRTHVAQIERSGDDDGDAAADAGSPPPSLSPFFVVPPTMRGVLWGCLLHVPAGRRREAIFAYAVHRTAAKPSLNDRQLAVDIPRCHAYHPLLASSKGSAQLQRLLKAWLFLHPRYAYWQGLDSVCAVLLTVSPHDEAMVLAQLDAIVDGFIAHDDGSGGGGGEDGFGSRSSLLMPAATASSPLTQQPKPKPSMADQLHRLSVVLRYCDPLLAHYLFGVLGCTPELYAISWLLTLFSHSLPTRKVHLLWDLLFVEGDVDSGGGSACLVALCAAVMVHRRAALLSSDFSGCLTAFSSGTSQLDVAAAVGDTRRLLSVLPPSVLAQPVADDVVDTPHGGRRPRQRPSALARGAAAAATAGSGGASSATDTATLAYLSVEDLKSAWAVAQRRTASSYDPTGAAAEGAAQRQQHWSDTGVYLVDIRPCDPRTGPHDSLLSAIHLPLHPAGVSPTPSASLSFGHIAPPSPRTAEVPDRAPQNGSRGDRRSRQDVDEVEQRTTAATAGEGWGIVDEQERLQEQQQLTQEAQERHVADAAAELVRFMGNPFVAAIVPCTSDASDRGASWAVHPLVLKTSMAPHVVIVAGDGKSTSSNSSTAGESEEVELAHQLGLQLNACGVHNVSVLRGGMAAIRVAMPELVVPHAQES
ncbi:hypothetical protein ABB37_09646 [Leptomonas pyrrhocoris]|uniref:Uncharacterized protein n=1 Tax=Leptomonas pyrrhocoris TaxID=157538 RepID=A0A0N0DQT5_LEPPY|nr:hypothetical protein ABB37_09646 [Leptomonas pyrrhocoris]KPA73742.1 hypothetical protein ABB37_09646 [Leptomonas pyrrhocoris]|eukprot:XP_015652181.1 hypothetical protein ABB37_09646 [Leptomonas pyrrhocoris]